MLSCLTLSKQKMPVPVLIFFITLFFAKGSCGALCKERDPCRCTLSSNDSRISLSGIGNADKPRFTNVPPSYDPNVSIALYSYNPCFSFSEIDSTSITKKNFLPCTNAAACKFVPGTGDGKPAELHAIALQSTGVFNMRGQSHYIDYSAAGSSLSVKLVCNEAVDAELSIDNAEGFIHNMTLTSKCACPDHKGCDVSGNKDTDDNRLSTGSIMLIVFFTIVVSYFILGIIYKFCNGATGAELVPNLEFWVDVPKLIKEGCCFTHSCIAGKKDPPATYDHL